MTPETAFSIVNVLPLPVWACWMLAPRSRAARWLADSWLPVAVLCGIYALLVFGTAFGGSGAPDFSTLAGVQAIFASPWGALAGWVHYLAFDLFVGRWMVRDALDAGYRLAPFLFFTLMFGPLGFGGYLLARGWLKR